MSRICSLLAIAALIAISSGCNMCCTPFDNSGPVYNGGPCCGGDGAGRSGSAFGGEVIHSSGPVQSQPYYQGQ